MLCKTTNGITTKYVYGLGLIGEEKCGEFKTYHFDYRGSTRFITDINGNITDTLEYDAYGKVIRRAGSSFVIFGYNGRDGSVTDANGLIYMRARYYSSELRRFVNADVIKGNISNSPTLNRYAYVNGNPVSYIDPLGRIGILTTFLVTATIVLLPAVLSSCSPGQRTDNYLETLDDETDYSWVQNEPDLLVGRYDSIDAAVLGNRGEIVDYAKNHNKEVGYVVYERYGGYYVSNPQSGVQATAHSVKIDLKKIPSDAKAVAKIHTHPLEHEEGLVYIIPGYDEVVKSKLASYVVDKDGCVYVLNPNAKDYTDYKTVAMGMYHEDYQKSTDYLGDNVYQGETYNKFKK